MSVHGDISTVREFLARELECRDRGGSAKYVAIARRAVEAFERVAAYVGEEDRTKQVRDFDAVFGVDDET
jgi:hypothetical protein